MNAAADAAHDPYPWHWLFLLVAVIAGLAYLLFGVSPVRRVLLEAAPAGDVEDAYLLVHMPSVPHDGDMAERAEAWLSAMERNGYHPALLSEVHRRLAAGEGVPPRTIVLMFDPGQRRTFSVMDPILARHRFPAVWITDAGRNRDRRYVSSRLLDAMRTSGRWDVGHYEEASRLVIERPGAPPLVLAPDGRVWKAGGGRRALNRGVPRGGLERLHINWEWSGRDIVERLRAEEPLHGRGALSCLRIQGHKWGVIDRGAPSGRSGFTLKAPVDGRTDGMSWLGTRFFPDARFELDVRNLNGELWVLLRSDEEEGDGLGVCFANRSLSVTARRGGPPREVFRAALPDLEQPAAFSAVLVSSGTSLDVSVNGRSVARLEDLPASSKGIVRMKVYDKVQGAAWAEVTRFEVSAPDAGTPAP